MSSDGQGKAWIDNFMQYSIYVVMHACRHAWTDIEIATRARGRNHIQPTNMSYIRSFYR
jgi:hypothetical protein